ncbi:type 2 periplasmic-binding domain-containing protein [Planctobacterium marinum]|uniref:phosphate ABC transporter substrate-binding protein n=1 Tax=Planctobacterium marinum TaxID=1631968 RepID=UPI001E4F31F9|nr:phosphate ABC transporter substrate-binding protein [Planctobacterium marinum]MCC2604706.1 phosphate ABC transporter substrate-binding protein [Planctobacterium marinum]
MKKVLSQAVFLSCLLLPLFANSVSIVVHPSNSSALSKDDIVRIFLGKQSEFPGGGAAVPISLPESNPTTDKFVADVLGKSPAQLKSYWAKLVFTGQGEPPEVLTDEQAILQKIKGNPAYIGFVSDAAVGDLRVISTF